MPRTVQRGQPTRQIGIVADSGFASLELLTAVSSNTLGVVTRLRLDAALYEPSPQRATGRLGRPRKKGRRLPTLATGAADPTTPWQRLTVALWQGETNRPVEVASAVAVWFYSGMRPVVRRWVLIRDPQGRFKTQALLGTGPQATEAEIVQWFVQRWQLKVTFEEVRAHLGIESQRQWSKGAIARTTPLLLALFSIVTLLADRRVVTQAIPVHSSAWYRKRQPTFGDVLARVRRPLWASEIFSMSHPEVEVRKIPPPGLERLIEALSYAV